jgi:hypothetical protein
VWGFFGKTQRMDNYDELNDAITQKVGDSKRRLVEKMRDLGMKHGQNKEDGERLTNVRTLTRENEGLITRIRYRFKQSGVFVHKGVGKGRPISSPGTPKEWFNPVIEDFADELADTVLDGMIDVSAKKLLIK